MNNLLWRYRKEGEFDQFSYVEGNDEDSEGYDVTMFVQKITKECGSSYDTVCPPSICDCRGKAQEK